MDSVETFVVLGAGQGAGHAVATLRSKGFQGRIVLIGEENFAPYQRPPLSKAFLTGEMELDRLFIRPKEYYDQQDVELILGVRAQAVDCASKTITLDDGRSVAFDKLLLMTGTRPRKLDIEGSDLPGVCYLRSIDDVRTLQKYFKQNKSLVVIGGGFIGLEVAAVAKKRGMDVTVIELGERVMSRAVGSQVSDYFERLHQSHNVTIRTGCGIQGFNGGETLESVLCTDGAEIVADVAVVGVGAIPRTELAEAAGLRVGNGIVVDEYCATSDPNVYAAGDCTNHPNEHFGCRLRLESVHNAVEQAKTAATSMIGARSAYRQVPWFWSDQYDVKLQTAGLNQGHDEAVVRGDVDSHQFAVFYLKQGELIAVDAINSAPNYMMGRKLIEVRARPSVDQLADPSTNLKQFL